jgi:hypothetical protein
MPGESHRRYDGGQRQKKSWILSTLKDPKKSAPSWLSDLAATNIQVGSEKFDELLE